MLVEELIQKLQSFPAGTKVCVYDYRKNLGDDIGDGSSAGIYSDFDVELHKLEPDELEYYKEQNDKNWVNWIAIAFANEDYDDDGNNLLV